MQRRVKIVDMFSMLLCFKESGCQNNHAKTVADTEPEEQEENPSTSRYLSRLGYFWRTNSELKQQIQRLVDADGTARAEFWALLFLKICSSQPEKSAELLAQYSILAVPPPEHTSWSTGFPPQELSLILDRLEMHLFAYLQEPIWYAAKKISQMFKSIQHQYSLEDCFQIANLAAKSPVILLKNFNPKLATANIYRYPTTVIEGKIKDTIYTDNVEAKGQRCSDYGLLKNLRRRGLRLALTLQGLTANQINLSCLAWECFQEIYHPQQIAGRRSLQPPERKVLEQIAQRYNQRYQQLNLPGTPATWQTIQEMLSTCIKAARIYINPQFYPIENIENLPGTIFDSWDTAIQSEEWGEVQSLISNLFTAMPEEGQVLLKLSLGLDLTQKEIAAVLGNCYSQLNEQCKVSRQLNRLHQNLLKDFAKKWNQLHPEKCIAEAELTTIKSSMKECLQKHCQEILGSGLELIWKSLAISQSEISQNLAEIDRRLLTDFSTNLAKSLQLQPSDLSVGEEKLAMFVQSWLE